MNDLISIIVPVYNVEKYLNKCIDSIINQTYKNIEIILVDDGSTDNSGKICDEYLLRDSRIKVIHKNNGGLSSARNEGINISSGEYIGFVYSDDWVEPNMYEEMYKKILYSNADIVDCGYWKEYENKSIKYISANEVKFCGENLLQKCYLSNLVQPEVCRKLYKRYIFNNVKFPLNKYYEDAFIFIPTLNIIRLFIIIPSALYHYRQRKGGITKKNFNKKHLDILELHENEYQFIKRNMPECIEKAKSNIILGMKELLFKILDSRTNAFDNYIYKIQNKIRKNFYFIISSSMFNLKEKISLILIVISLKNFYYFTKIKRKKEKLKFYD